VTDASNSPDSGASARARFEAALLRLLVEHGATPGPALVERIHEAVDNMLDALPESALDGASLTPLDVVRIRANKLAAASLPAAIFRDPLRLARLRAELRTRSLAWLGATSTG